VTASQGFKSAYALNVGPVHLTMYAGFFAFAADIV
jgi:hypothetical protein